ncbi:MAG: glycosyltransferase [Anaerolineales bacterium]|nr:glycosyltransferase [Anaerolineales bacterium]
MHVLFVNKVAPNLGGGAEARIQEVGRRMVEAGHRVSVVCGITAPNLPSRAVLEGMDVRYVRTLPDSLLRRSRAAFTPSRVLFYLHPQTLKTLRQVHDENGVDVICDDISPIPTPGASQFARTLGIPAIGVVHNLSGDWQAWKRNYGIASGTAGYFAERWLRNTQPYQHIISDSAWMVDALATSMPRCGSPGSQTALIPRCFTPGQKPLP